MRKAYMIMVSVAIGFLLFWGSADGVYAETDDRLPVIIRTYDNESVAALSGRPLYASVPLCFKPEGSGQISYAISIDDGENFGGFAPMEQESVTLYPDDETSPGRRWQIKFQSVSDNAVAVSDVYNVIFDTTVPTIDFIDPEVINACITKDETVHFALGDENGISRIVAKCNDEVIFEEHYEAASEPKEYEAAVTLQDLNGAKGEVVLAVYDIAGNRNELSFSYLSDREAPKISASGVENDARLKGATTLTLSASDKESDVYIDYVIEKTTKEGSMTTEVTSAAPPVVLSFDEDAIYDISAYASDEAGRQSEVVKRHFVIDKCAPKVKITGVTDNVDARAPVGLSIEVDENLYDGSKVDITLIKRVLGKAEMIRMDTYDLLAYKDIRTVNISSDGEYELTVRATDSAGNSTGECRRFRMDMTAPDIALFGLSEGEVTKEEPVLSFCAGEMFYESTVLTAVLEKREKSGYVPLRTENRVMHSLQDRMDITVDKEGEYRLLCSASDRSGNSAATSINFTVDHTPPVITVTDAIDNRFLRSFKLPASLADIVKDMTGVAAVAFLNDRQIGDDDVIVEEGKYVLTILAEDEAGNASESESVFMIDHSAPQIVLTGFDTNGNIKKGSMVKVSLADEGDRLEEVIFNDRKIAIDPDNTAYFVVDEYGSYTLSVRAGDEAGNVTDTIIHTNCEMYAPSFLNGIRNETTVSLPKDDVNDIDVKGLLVGLITTLGGTFALAWRSRIRS